MKKRVMNEVEGITFDSILKLSEQKWGKRYTMGIIDILYLHHIKSRGICGSNEDDMKRYLMKEGYDSKETLSMIKRYYKVSDDLFQYDYRVNSIFDRLQSYSDVKSITSWENIDGRVIGLVKEENNKGYRVCDISDGKEKLLARINEGVYWVDTNLTTNQMSYITKNAKLLRTTNGGIL